VGFALRAAALSLFATGILLQSSCSASTSDCTCLVDNNGERRTLACGDTSCIGGTVLACADKEKVVPHGACSATPAPSDTPPSADSGAAPPSDPSCPNLAAFCGTSCSSPASVAADCLSVANAADPQACAAWQGANGLLCHP
jgi:hypothetical protein